MRMRLMVVGGIALIAALLSTHRNVFAEERSSVSLVRLAELAIDPAQIESYRAALQEEIETSIRLEPGVLALYAVAVKGHPTQIRIFEMYAGESAYRAHLQTPHFRRYKTATQAMVKSLRLVETEPVALGAKAR